MTLGSWKPEGRCQRPGRPIQYDTTTASERLWERQEVEVEPVRQPQEAVTVREVASRTPFMTSEAWLFTLRRTDNSTLFSTFGGWVEGGIGWILVRRMKLGGMLVWSLAGLCRFKDIQTGLKTGQPEQQVNNWCTCTHAYGSVRNCKPVRSWAHTPPPPSQANAPYYRFGDSSEGLLVWYGIPLFFLSSAGESGRKLFLQKIIRLLKSK